jgi:hypothetical protein
MIERDRTQAAPWAQQNSPQGEGGVYTDLNEFVGTLNLRRGLAMPSPYRDLSWFQFKLV